MILPPVARRSLAIAATTALMTSGAAGLFTGTANAANAATVTSVSPSATNNSGDTYVTVTGSGFATTPSSPTSPNLDSIYFSLHDTTNSYYGAQTPPLVLTAKATDTDNPHTSTTYGLKLGTANAAPGYYDVYDHNSSGDGPKCVKCFYIGSRGAPDVTNIVPGSDTSNCLPGDDCNLRGANSIDILGRNLVKASKVNLLLPNGQPDLGPDTAKTAPKILVGDLNNDGIDGAYLGSVIYAEISVSGDNFTPGKHLVNVTNTLVAKDAAGTPTPETGGAGELWFPKFAAAGVSPTTFGQGVNNRVITIHGAGIRQGSHISIQNLASDLDPSQPTNPDNTVGAATVSADGTTISAPVSFATDAQKGTLRAVTISGPDGGHYSVGNLVSVTAAPEITDLGISSLGQGGSVEITITGSGFAAGASAATLPSFSVSGAGVTIAPKSSTNLQVVAQITAEPDAPTGDRTVTVTNPDGGSSTYEGPDQNTPALTINAGPTITSVSPASAAAGTSKTITIKGLHYDDPTSTGDPFAKPTVQFSLPPVGGAARTADSSVSVGTVTVSKANNVTTFTDQVSFTLSVSGSAPSGLRDIVLTNPSDDGAVLCAGCFGVDNLTVAPASGSNSGTKSIAMTGAGVVAGSTAKLVRAGDPTIQPAIPGNSATVSGTTLTAIFDLTDAAPGPYNAVVTAPNGAVSSCSSCFTVTGATPSITSISPAAGGQGAVNLPITVTGTNFSRGEQLTITDVLVHDVVWVSRTQLTAKVDIATDAPVGAKDAKATNADGAVSSAVKSGAFTVTAPPNPTASTPASYGQGAKGVKITVTGPNFDAGAKVSFGPGVTVTGVAVTQGQEIPIIDPTPDDTLEATVTIDENAAAIQRDVVVTNSDGGVGTLANGFAVNFGPKVTGVTPGFLAPNAVDKPITIAGSNFSTTSGKTAVPTIAGVTLKNVVVAADGNSITATATVNAGTAKGGKDVVVTNPTDSGAGTCASCLYVATPPGAPTALGLVSRTASSITVKWTPPSDNGGAPITSYVVSAKDSTGHAAGTAGTTAGNAVQGTVSGLKSTTAYTVLVVARNAAGDSTPGSMSASTTGANQFGGSFTTSTHSPSLTTTGGRVTLSGRLLKVSTGSPIVGATIELALVPDIGSAVFPKVTTNSNGVWSFGFNPVYSNTIKTIYRGDASHDPYQAPSYRMGVSTRVTITSPGNFSTSSASTPLVVRGLTSPNKSGKLITLYRWNGSVWYPIQNRTVASNGSYAFTFAFGRGNWTLKVGIGRTTGNFVGYSPALGIHRV